MIECNIRLRPSEYGKENRIRSAIAQQLKIKPDRIQHWELMRRSVDARHAPKFMLRYQVWIDEAFKSEEPTEIPIPDVSKSPVVHIVGLGPAGIFAALRLIELGMKPIIFERGKSVQDRRRDIALLNRDGLVNPESNYCYGEGGAGTFSDGKLYTRSYKRGNIRSILDTFVRFGATRDIMIDAHPHIGTNKLPQIIQNMREYILKCGGEVHFEKKLSGLKVEAGGKLTGFTLEGESTEKTDALILATGHSARGIYQMLHQQGLKIEAKPFALGIRVEHPQAIIDQIQYHCEGDRHENLPAAAYTFSQQIESKGVYSFCMCPGGIICPATTADEELVVNGWSPSRRDSRFANSGVVVEVSPKDFGAEDDPLAGLDFQQVVERLAFKAGGGKQVAPAQRLTDFVKQRDSINLPDCSYLPGVAPADLRSVLPDFVYRKLRKVFKRLDKKMKGFYTQEAIVVAVESRTSSPVRITRETESLMHPQAAGLIPCGEGAGYAGGIMSAAMDGIRCAEAAKKFVEKN